MKSNLLLYMHLSARLEGIKSKRSRLNIASNRRQYVIIRIYLYVFMNRYLTCDRQGKTFNL